MNICSVKHFYGRTWFEQRPAVLSTSHERTSSKRTQKALAPLALRSQYFWSWPYPAGLKDSKCLKPCDDSARFCRVRLQTRVLSHLPERQRRVKTSACYKFSFPVKRELSECSVTVIVVHHMHLENSSAPSASVTGATWIKSDSKTETRIQEEKRKIPSGACVLKEVLMNSPERLKRANHRFIFNALVHPTLSLIISYNSTPCCV